MRVDNQGVCKIEFSSEMDVEVLKKDIFGETLEVILIPGGETTDPTMLKIASWSFKSYSGASLEV
jgi:hypothetical protein